MKIVNDTIWWEFECVACHVTCQAEIDDVTYRDRKSNDFKSDHLGLVCVVECGKCGKEHDVPAEKMTKKIERIAIDKYQRDTRDF